SIFIRKYYIFSENYTEQVKHGSRKCTKRVSWNTRYLNLVEKNLTHTGICRNLKGAGRCAKIKVMALLENGHGMQVTLKSVQTRHESTIFSRTFKMFKSNEKYILTFGHICSKI
ncbi:hypothetical protein, partial [Heyndrickxia coagulans]|uniref:hypothetical protein n=1 Tax=Heyndrickxia coagulans TaxID=1398 RepID=UPI0019D67790